MTSEYTWDDFCGKKLLPGDLENIRQALIYRRTNPSDMFQYLLTSWYFNERLSRIAGDAIYRLSDLILLEQRSVMYVTSFTDTLEEWRQDWVATLKNGEEDVSVFEGQPPEISC